ncbi:DUF6427 family protein [Pontimicrobium aquaticum]|uniref:Uncharacterized protein n=1 Tax=Pontimicrobium aquaticum TaxID=2565367 RepID=A0A4U0ESN3_9FLAO|nr:DUF6427 family protein [Pontimicrobium aquaticum]TJY34751.1 hypothetical protein E5167_10610 [Pontimicrobium aquaticum]
MITRFFSTSKPIHLVLVSVFVFGLFLMVRLGYYNEGVSITQILKEVILYGVTLLSIFVLSFVVNKNNLTKKNSFKILLFSLFLACIPETLQHGNIIVSNVFVLFAIRRIISLKSNLNIKKKLFDAAFWIALASLFYFWSILFLILVFSALILFSITKLNNWMVPFIAIIALALIIVSYNIITNDIYYDLNKYLDSVSFNFSNYDRSSLIVVLSIILSLGLWALFFYIKKLPDKSRAFRPAFVLILIALLTGVVIIVISPNKNGSEFIFLFAPLAIIMTNYIESVKKPWLSEAYLWMLLLAPLAAVLIS